VVGAIAGKTGIPSRSIGKIDIFDRHAFKELLSPEALCEAS
jgi:hypothetical protein